MVLKMISGGQTGADLAGLKAAYNLAERDGMEFTDDAGVMEYAGLPAHIVRNPDNNIKITYSEDIGLLEYIKLHR